MNAHLLAADAADSLDGFNAAVAFLRVAVGITFAAHGYNKFFGGGKIPGTARWFDSIGMKPNGTIHAYVSACTELGAGLLLAAGLLTPLAGAGMVGIMVVAAYTVNRPNGFFSANHGWEYNLVLAVVGIAVATMGPGRYSLDKAIGLDLAFNPKVGLAVSAGLGIGSAVLLIATCFRPPAKAEG
ncbi:MAG: DoxX family protein [Acidimicrobiales bacterium]